MKIINQEKLREIINRSIIPLRKEATATQKEALISEIYKACEHTITYENYLDARVVLRKKEAEIFKKDKKILDAVFLKLEKLSPGFKEHASGLIVASILESQAQDEIIVIKEDVQVRIATFYAQKHIKAASDYLRKIKVLDVGSDSQTCMGCINYKPQKSFGSGSQRNVILNSYLFHLRLIIEKWFDDQCVDFRAHREDRLSTKRFNHGKVIKEIGEEILDILSPETDCNKIFSLLRKNYPHAEFTPYLVIDK